MKWSRARDDVQELFGAIFFVISNKSRKQGFSRAEHSGINNKLLKNGQNQERNEGILRPTTADLIRIAQQEIYTEMRYKFISLGKGKHYTNSQKEYAFGKIHEYGIKATSRILAVPRRTLQRWCRQYGIHVSRCPEWVFEWAAKRRKKREFWERRGYF